MSASAQHIVLKEATNPGTCEGPLWGLPENARWGPSEGREILLELVVMCVVGVGVRPHELDLSRTLLYIPSCCVGVGHTRESVLPCH